MTEIKKRKIYSAEFKTKVGLEALKEQKTINQLVQEYGIHPNIIRQWKQEIQDQAKTLFTAKRGTKAASEPMDSEQLYSKIGKLEMSLDWLKKKSGLNLPQ